MQEEEALIAAHRKEIEDTMEIVREVSYYMFFFFPFFTCKIYKIVKVKIDKNVKFQAT